MKKAKPDGGIPKSSISESKKEQRKKIQSDVEKFLAEGGKINKMKQGDQVVDYSKPKGSK